MHRVSSAKYGVSATPCATTAWATVTTWAHLLIKDQSLADLDNLPDPDVLASDIIENLEAAVESFKEIIAAINGKE